MPVGYHRDVAAASPRAALGRPGLLGSPALRKGAIPDFLKKICSSGWRFRCIPGTGWFSAAARSGFYGPTAELPD